MIKVALKEHQLDCRCLFVQAFQDKIFAIHQEKNIMLPYPLLISKKGDRCLDRCMEIFCNCLSPA